MSEEFVLTNENYYDKEADERLMSVHQFLDFVGYLGIRGCEVRALAKIKGEYKEETTKAMLVGSYVDAYFEGTLPQFKLEHPEIFTQKGTLRAEFNMAEKMIARCERDEFFMKMLSGEKQRIMTAYLFGCEWKCKMDSYIPDVAIVDLKTSANIHKSWNVADYGNCSFVEYWGYTVQMAVYQKIVEINTGKKLPCYIAVVTKEDEPEIEVISIDQMTLDHALNYVEMNMASVLMVKSGEVEPTECCKCDYCKSRKVLKRAISMQDLIEM
jgi:hypothetical protein